MSKVTALTNARSTVAVTLRLCGPHQPRINCIVLCRGSADRTCSGVSTGT